MCTMCAQISVTMETCAFASNDETSITTGSLSAPTENGSLDQLADFLVEGYWGSQRSFNTSASNTIDVNLTGLAADGQVLARAALESWEMVANIEFRETSGSADITFQDSAAGAYATFTMIGADIVSATVNFGAERLDRYGTSLDTYAFQNYIHEIGHALGLGHIGPYNGGAEYDTHALFRNDSWSVSVMSYFNQNENPSDNASYARVSTTMIADIAAIQSLYGAANGGSVTSGNTVYGAGSTLDNYLGHMLRGIATGQRDALYTGKAMSYTIWDTDGIDTIDYSFSSANQTIRLAAEARSDVNGGVGNLTIARGTVIENATTGAGNDMIIGNQADNTVRAGGGNDLVSVLDGSDLVYGGDGNDTVYAASGNDTIYGGEGHDVIWLSTGNDLGLSGDGNDRMGGGHGDDTLYAGQGDDVAFGGAGNDIVGGGGGNDQIYGGAGNDTVYGGSGDDTVGGGIGNDVIYSGTGNDIVYGGAGNDTMGAGAGNDYLAGGTGHDIIYAGAGNDTVFGGPGNDTIYASAGTDIVTGGEGTDIFVFTAGNDTIADFTIAEDRVKFSSVARITNFADLLNHISDRVDGALIEVWNGDTLLLNGVRSAELSDSDFIF